LFDVIEHIEDDQRFMQHMAGLLIPGGTLYASVPAYNALWSHEDIAAGHHRRHTVGSMHRLCAAAGLRVEFATYIFRPLPLPVLMMRTLPFRLGLARPNAPADVARDHAAGNPLISRVTSRLLAPEIRNIKRGRPMRFGGSVLIAARKPPATA
jgi:SAM-dependent methyltransferase